MNVVLEVAKNSADRGDLVVKVDWGAQETIQNLHEINLLSLDLEAHVGLIFVYVHSHIAEDHEHHVSNIAVDS